MLEKKKKKKKKSLTVNKYWIIAITEQYLELFDSANEWIVLKKIIRV